MLDVSAIIPAYNRAATVGRAIESALAQTMPPREIVVVDDGSTDTTMAVVERYRASDRRVVSIRQTNGGAGAARNAGIAASSGEWLALLDSDDAWHPEKLARAAALVDASPSTALVHSNVEFVEADGTIRHWDRHTPAQMIDPTFLIGSFFMRTSSVLFRRSLLVEVGDWFPTDRATCEDFDVFWRLIATSPKIGYVPSRDVFVHVTSDGLTRLHSEARLVRDNISTMGGVLRWMQSRPSDARYRAVLRSRCYWELRQLFAIWLRAKAWQPLAQDFRRGAVALSGLETARAFASAGLSLLKKSS